MNIKVESRFEHIEQMQRDGKTKHEMANELGISLRHMMHHLGLMRGIKYTKRKTKAVKETSNCTVCGIRFEPVLRDYSASKCEACYLSMLLKANCVTCKQEFVVNGNFNKKTRRTACYTCKPPTKDISESIPRMWRDSRWFTVFKRHDSGCLICGSNRANTRDGRFCDWRHDPDYLDDMEAEALLKETGMF